MKHETNCLECHKEIPRPRRGYCEPCYRRRLYCGSLARIPKPDLVGQRFGQLVVMERLKGPVANKRRWRCRCDCGQETCQAAFCLLQGNSTSCGCGQRRRGALSPKWKGGRTVHAEGYILINRPDHPRAHVKGYVYEHILVAEEMLGRALLPGEQVHHIDHNPQNNTPENLCVVPTQAAHGVHHRHVGCRKRLPGEDNPMVLCACDCGEAFLCYDTYGRPRRYVHNHFSKMTKQERAYANA